MVDLSARCSVHRLLIGIFLFLGTFTGCAGEKSNKAAAFAAQESAEFDAVDSGLETQEEDSQSAADTSPNANEVYDSTSATDRQADEQLASAVPLATGLPGNSIQIFFATDRRPTSEVVPGLLRTYLPAFCVSLICSALFIGAFLARRFQSLWIIGCGISVCLGLVVLHSCIIRNQQYSRLARDASTRFSTSRYLAPSSAYPLYVGTATVSLPDTHQPGRVEAPSLLRLEFIENPEKHIVLRTLHVDEDLDSWLAKIDDEVKYASEREAFIFIHGFNVRFAASLKRTAQLAVDLGVEGPVISYSWPSKGQISAYSTDEASVSWSAPHFERLLVDLKSRTDCRRFNIIAHSMGNRALLESIERIYLRMGKKATADRSQRIVQNLVLAAPDIDVDTFESRYVEAINAVANRTTLYFSEDDFALRLSSGIHGAGRAGLNAGQMASIKGIDKIHIGSDDLFSLGHSYYGSDRVVLDDIRRLMGEEPFASQRAYLTRIANDDGHEYWRLDRQRHASLSGTQLR